MGSPYREGPSLLLCPRCAEMLDRAFEGAWPCPRCEGLWLAPATLDAAFGDPHWPAGQAMWWRNSIECPECAIEGKATVMTARMSSGVIVDQCADHGVWLDRGELGRLMGVADNAVGALRARVAATAPEVGQLVEERERWRADLESRRQAIREYKQMLDNKLRDQLAIAHAQRARLEAEAADPPPLSAPSIAPAPAPAPASTGAATPTRALPIAAPPSSRADFETLRAQTAAEVASLEHRLGVLDQHIYRLTGELAETRRRVLRMQDELDAARARLRSLDERLS